MNTQRTASFNILVISAVVICYEILSTKISSLIFVQNYAFIVLSLAVLGLGCGGVYSFYRIKPEEGSTKVPRTLSLFLFLSGGSVIVSVVLEIFLSITSPAVYFILLFFPFFFAGIIYAEFFSTFASAGFRIYASDLAGAALGAVVPIYIFTLFNAANAVLLLGLILFVAGVHYLSVETKRQAILYTVLFCCILVLTLFGKRDLLGKIPIGHFPEKDIYYTYGDLNSTPTIIDSRWSINGRSDLVEYPNHGFVKDLFIDGAAGSQMYKFDGNIAHHDTLLNDLLVHNSTTIPLFFLPKEERDNMLVIGPGGGKEILAGVLGGVRHITGVEVNPDFVDIVKDNGDFNGGIYTKFPNVKIMVAEGRHFIKSTSEHYNVIVLALPSTKQLQNIDGLASNENYLLTVEAIRDYLDRLTQDGQLIFTVHNRWELVRLIVTALTALRENGVANSAALDHFIVLGSGYAPTIVVRKSAYTPDEITGIANIAASFPADYPRTTYLPYLKNPVNDNVENILFQKIRDGRTSLEELIARNSSDISPVRDDSPFFYKVNKGVPGDFVDLLTATSAVALLSVILPLGKMRSNLKRNRKDEKKRNITLPLMVFIGIGVGFMILEISLFQKFILYLGSPTIALSTLLASLLVGMGAGSFFGGKIYSGEAARRLKNVSGLIVVAGLLLLVLHPMILNELLPFGLVVRAAACFVLLSPFGFVLGIPFPTAIQMLKQNELVRYIPWMYGVNGIMSVLGSVLSVVLSMMWGFTVSFIVGLAMYFFIFIFLVSGSAITGRS